jgi:UDP-glucose:(heptosyl)LPS alpha-1,3-glucosyltransferase
VTDRRALRRQLNLPEEETLLLFVGHEFGRKGLRPIIEGLARCPAAGRTQLLVVGRDDPAPYRRLAASRGLGDRVRFFGPRSDVHRFFAAADLFIFLSNYESFGLVGLEALSSGVPVIASRVSGLEDYVKEGENGLLVERDPESLAQALTRVLNDSELFERLRTGARPSTESYAWSKIADQYLAAFKRIRDERA